MYRSARVAHKENAKQTYPSTALSRGLTALLHELTALLRELTALLRERLCEKRREVQNLSTSPNVSKDKRNRHIQKFIL